MTLCNVVQVHYINIDASTREANTGIYAVDDLQVSPDSDDVVICSWLISQNATKYVGSLNFIVRFSCVAEDSTIDYVWNTAVHSGVSVNGSIYNGSAVVEESIDILEKWRKDIEASSPPIEKDNNGGVVQTVEREERQNEAVSSSAAFGQWNRVRKGYSIAAGWGNQIDAEKTAAVGAYNLLSGNANFANGRCNEAKGYAGAVLGQDNISLADNAMCFGESLIATVPGQVVVGRNNAPNDDAVFIVGNGDVHRQNAFTVLKDGRVTMSGVFEETVDNFYALREWDLNGYDLGKEMSLSTAGSIVPTSLGMDGTAYRCLKVTSNSNAGGRRPQVIVCGGNYGKGVEKVRVEKGKSYIFSFSIYNTNCIVRYWLCATDSTSGFTETSQKNACVIYETKESTEIKKADAFKWTTVTVEIPECAYSGYLRLGICSNDTASATFYVKDIAIKQTNVPIYNYVSKDGKYSTKLYKICELQSVAEHTYDWLFDNETQIMYGNMAFPSPIDEMKCQGSAVDAYYDDQQNVIYVEDGKVMLACVSRIVPDKMDVQERGLYVDESVFALYYQKWTDSAKTL